MGLQLPDHRFKSGCRLQRNALFSKGTGRFSFCPRKCHAAHDLSPPNLGGKKARRRLPSAKPVWTARHHKKFPALSEDKAGRIKKTKGHAPPRPFSSKPRRQKGPPPPAFGRTGLDGSETKTFCPAWFSDGAELGLRKSSPKRRSEVSVFWGRQSADRLWKWPDTPKCRSRRRPPW